MAHYYLADQDGVLHFWWPRLQMKRRILSTGFAISPPRTSSGQQVLSQAYISASNFGREEATPPVWSGRGGMNLIPATGRCHHPALHFPERNVWSSRTRIVLSSALPLAPNICNCVIIPTLTVHLQMPLIHYQHIDGNCFSSELKYFQMHFHIVCSGYFFPANGVIFSLLWWQWEPGGEGQAGHRDVHLTPHIPSVQALNTAVAFWGAKGGIAAQELDK